MGGTSHHTEGPLADRNLSYTRIPMSNAQFDLNQLQQQALAALEAVSSADALEAWRITYLGQRGQIKLIMGRMKDIPAADRPAFGQRANSLKTTVESAYEDRKARFSLASTAESSNFDITEPGIPPVIGRRHVLSRTIDELIEVFARMGFSVAQGPEVEDDWHNFVALNIPADHPARDPMDNFYIDGSHLLRTQTSTVQIRVMENIKPPIRVIAPGRVYRPDEVDATHSFMFHQIEGLCVDKGISMVDLKTTLLQFAHAYFGPEAEIRLRPSFFPFTEPSAELDIRMKVKGAWQWVELGGCGMVNPRVFEAVGYDPETYSGFAFGMGIERIAMRKYGIPDIRWFYENDLRFLRQV